MRLVCCSVRDVKAEQFSRPFFSVALGEALRSFQVECENVESMLHRFPDDFRLFKIGEFSQDTGKFESCLPVDIACARDFVKLVKGEQLELMKEVV